MQSLFQMGGIGRCQTNGRIGCRCQENAPVKLFALCEISCYVSLFVSPLCGELHEDIILHFINYGWSANLFTVVCKSKKQYLVRICASAY